MPRPEEIREKLAVLLARIANTPRDDVRDTATLKDLGVDSVAMVELAEGVATTFGAHLPDDEVNAWRTVGDVVRSVQRSDREAASRPPSDLPAPALADPERLGAFKQLAIIFAVIGAGIGVFIGVGAAALLASGLGGGGSMSPITSVDDPTPTASPSASDPYGPAPNGSASPSSSAAAGNSLSAQPANVQMGQRFLLSGQLSGAQAGEKLVVEWRESGGSWASFPIDVTAQADGSFESHVYISSPGERQFRVRSTSSGKSTPPATVTIS